MIWSPPLRRPRPEGNQGQREHRAAADLLGRFRLRTDVCLNTIWAVVDADWEDDGYIATWHAHGGRGLRVTGSSARKVLAARLAIRRRARWAAAAFGVPAALAFGVSAWLGWPDDRDANGAAVLWWMLAVALFAAAPLARADAVRRGERELARSLPRRVSAVAREPMRSRVGALRVANLGLAVVFNVALLTAMLLDGSSPALVVSFGAVLAMVLGCVFVTLRDLMRRPRLAVVAQSLLVDRRLRSRVWYLAMWPLVMVLAGPSRSACWPVSSRRSVANMCCGFGDRLC